MIELSNFLLRRLFGEYPSFGPLLLEVDPRLNEVQGIWLPLKAFSKATYFDEKHYNEKGYVSLLTRGGGERERERETERGRENDKKERK